MQQGIITEIGAQAIDEQEKILIFFGETATSGLREYTIIQKISEPEKIAIAIGDTITFGEQSYQVNHLGNLVLNNLHDIQHVTFIFNEVPAEDVIGNGVYLTPSELPKIEVGMTVTYPSK